MWLSNDDNTLEDKLSLQQILLLESRIARPETPLGVEACTRCCAMGREKNRRRVLDFFTPPLRRRSQEGEGGYECRFIIDMTITK
jgi:hypothetical protein